jgi:hypothetical protein
MGKSWTDKENAYLREHYNSLPISDIEAQLQRKAEQIRSHVYYLRRKGFKFHRRADA